MVALLFPGQGSQTTGMGLALAERFPEARAVFQEADEALDFPLSRLCFEGPDEALKKTEVTQPALLTVSIAALRALESALGETVQPRFLAGHSLGEWSALVAAGALRFADAVRLVRERGRLMQRAVPEGEGAMAAVMGLDPVAIMEITREIAARNGVMVAPANFNAPDQTVVSGHAAALEALEPELTQAGATKVVRLAVSAPFHSPLMQPAADGLAAALDPIEIQPLTAPVFSNVEAAPHPATDRVKALLVQQVTAPVRWTEIVRGMVEAGEKLAFELGSGKVLMGLARKIDRGLKVIPVGEPSGIEKALAALA